MANDQVGPGCLLIAQLVISRDRVAVYHYPGVFPGWTNAVCERNQLIFNESHFDTFINPPHDEVIFFHKRAN